MKFGFRPPILLSRPWAGLTMLSCRPVAWMGKTGAQWEFPEDLEHYPRAIRGLYGLNENNKFFEYISRSILSLFEHKYIALLTFWCNLSLTHDVHAMLDISGDIQSLQLCVCCSRVLCISEKWGSIVILIYDGWKEGIDWNFFECIAT